MGLNAVMHLIPDQFAHFAEYFLLTVSLWCARSDDNKDSLAAGYAKVFLLVSIFALTDEFHQGFVPHRTPDIRDYSADTMGSLVALAWIHFFGMLSDVLSISRQP
jgi:VanZ family protein